MLQRMHAADADQPSSWSVYLGDVPATLAQDIAPDRELFLTEEDALEREQSLWLSTKGAQTHTHFDSDHNLFYQLLGTKRWYLFPPGEGLRFCPFPRLHPL